MKLKTLKDMIGENVPQEYEPCNDDWCEIEPFVKWIKGEAINWIKESQEEQNEALKDTQPQGKIRYEREYAVQRFIKHFFNITEEDLK